MRDALVYYGSRLQMARTGAPTNQDVVVGPTKWLFYDQYYVPGQPHFADTIGKDPLSPSALKTIGANVQAVHEALKVCKIPFYFVIAPDKQSVYPEKLGIHIPTAAQSNADQLIEYLRTTDSGLNIIDLRNPLVTARAGAPFDLYKRTDTHWNSLGAFYGYQAIVRRLTADRILPASPRSDLADWDVTQAPFDNGDIAVNLLSLPGYFEDYNTHFEAKTARHAQWSGDERRRQSQNPEGLGNLVMYRDSFAGELLPFLAEDFESTVSFLSHEVDGDTVRNTKPSVVMLQIVGRNIRMLKEGPKNLGHICTP
ncbi:alginate O-acetyltransferase AlgX-related protein [Pandoraea terrae]|nr:alginate O-acetyltransferase [Pandoraea terrae]